MNMNDLLSDALSELESKNTLVTYEKQLSSGKEATIFLVSKGNELLALKVYKDYSTRSFKRNQDYLAGRYIKRPSERKAIRKKNRFGKALMHKLWVKREFYMLKKLFNSEVRIPKPIEMTKNAILMEYIGKYDLPAPLLKDVKLDKKQKKLVFNEVMRDIDIMFQYGIVHGDLSSFNILYWDDKPYIIDFPQSLDIRNNPNVGDVLERDKDNILKWYKS